jgi:hypothetical protein
LFLIQKKAALNNLSVVLLLFYREYEESMKMETFQTRDLSEAAFLYASGRKFSKLNSDGQRFWFVFDGKHECKKLADSYWRKEATINAKEMSDALRTLKDMIFNRETRP